MISAPKNFHTIFGLAEEEKITPSSFESNTNDKRTVDKKKYNESGKSIKYSETRKIPMKQMN